MTGAVSTKVVAGTCRALSLGLRTAEYEYKRGNGGPVLLDDGKDTGNGNAELDQKEAELLEQLAAVRKQKLARN